MIADLDSAFAALADGTRRAIVERLATGEACVTDLATPFRMSLPAVSKHLRVLSDAGLVEVRVDAQRRIYELRAAPLRELEAWLERYRRVWEANYRRLDALLDEMKSSARKSKGRRRTKR